MTVTANRSEHDKEQITLTVTSGSVVVFAHENYEHLRSVWGHLGDLIKQIEEEQHPLQSA